MPLARQRSATLDCGFNIIDWQGPVDEGLRDLAHRQHTTCLYKARRTGPDGGPYWSCSRASLLARVWPARRGPVGRWFS